MCQVLLIHEIGGEMINNERFYNYKPVVLAVVSTGGS
jgi:hypothetical protein